MIARTGLVLINILFALLLMAWPLLSLAAIFVLRQKPTKDTARAVWALVITAVPIMGALAFFIAGTQPAADCTPAEE